MPPTPRRTRRGPRRTCRGSPLPCRLAVIPDRGTRARSCPLRSTEHPLLAKHADLFPRVAALEQHFLGVLAELGSAVANRRGRRAELDRRLHVREIVAAAVWDPRIRLERERLWI